MLCVQTGKYYDDPDRMRFTGHEFYLKNYDEMAELFTPLCTKVAPITTAESFEDLAQ